MTTAAERLVELAGQSGEAGTLLLLIGQGATAGEALADYSGLDTATADVHLMTDVASTARFQMDYGVFVPPRRRKEEPEPPVDETYDEEIAVLLLAA